MDMYKLKFTRLQYEIIRILMIKAGEKLTQRQIAGYLKVSPTAVAKSIPELEKDSMILVKKSDKMNLNLVELNRASHKVLELKRTENLKMIFESGLSDFLEEKYPSGTIIIFGSFARLMAGKDSDLDLFIISNKEEKLPFHLLPYKIHKNSLSEESFKKAIAEKETLIKEIEANHIILNNPSPYINMMWEYYGK